MSLETWLACTAATIVLLVIPGPTVGAVRAAHRRHRLAKARE